MTAKQHPASDGDGVTCFDACIGRFLEPTDPFMDCDQCFAELDDAVEAALTRGTAYSEALRIHLRACDVCRDDEASLVALTAADLRSAPARNTRLHG
ncbi:MAG: hypothetical protein JST73_06420 [Actinobacteria bacterium]|nr:hypothetical protein [Actinomycetota bacterium]